jgi:hypothetical protein
MSASQGANINWVKDIYIEQEFDVLNDSVFLLKRDHMMSDFALRKKEESKGVYGKRTTLYRDYVFNKELESEFYNKEVNAYNDSINYKSDEFWEENRFESLNKDEKGVRTKCWTPLKPYRSLSTCTTWWPHWAADITKWANLTTAIFYLTFGFNSVEGWRLRTGGRTYFGPNDP